MECMHRASRGFGVRGGRMKVPHLEERKIGTKVGISRKERIAHMAEPIIRKNFAYCLCMNKEGNQIRVGVSAYVMRHD